METNSWHEKISHIYFGDVDSLDLWGQLLVAGTMLALVVFVAIVTYFLIRKFVVRIFGKLAKMTENDWDDELMNSRVFRWLSMLLPVTIIWHAAPEIFSKPGMEQVETIGGIIRVVSEVMLVALVLLAINSVLNVGERIYSRYEVSKELPIKSFFQVIKIVLTLVGIIFIISTIVDKSPVLIFSGLGAMTAVLMLIFKDSLLGLVAGIQLSANRMVARGDWIEMPKFGADGEVLEVALTTVKVRNWDKTITTIPTYALISDSFKNWRGMSNSGVRRIKRSLNLDMNSVKFLDDALLARLKNVSLLKDYLAAKEKEIQEWNSERGVAKDDLINARGLTNIGTFRAYIAEYLKNHPNISDHETLLVRQLAPSKSGLPIEIYVFCNDNRWVQFEGIQSDIFDHFLSVLREFELSVFQSPTGADFTQKFAN